jgi:TrmH family RNA methyltransferase
VIPLDKLAKLSPKHRMRKTALVLGELERDLLAGGGVGARFLIGLAALFEAEEEAPEALRAAAADLGRIASDAGIACDAGVASDAGVEGTELPPEDWIRAVDALRHALLSASGQAPADWDLIDPSTGTADPGSRRIFPLVKAYLEDLRSPFNVGSVFRTADALGVEELILSPSCADPTHPRALRSAMGAVDLVNWRRSGLDILSGDIPVFALELGGEPVERFAFPDRGIVILGSEELGISREARRLSTYGTVSIPMLGAKASLNVAVAFGILMYAWSRSLQRSGSAALEMV